MVDDDPIILDVYRRQLQDRRALVPARREELHRCNTGQPGDEQDEHVGQSEADVPGRFRTGVEDDADEGVIAATIRDCAADKGQQ